MGRTTWMGLGLCGLLVVPSPALRAQTRPEDARLAPLPAGVMEHAILADLDLDGDRDLIVPSRAGPDPLRILQNDRDADFVEITRSVTLPPLFGGVVHVAAGDLDGDRDADLVTCSAHWDPAEVSSICRLLQNAFVPTGVLSFADVTDVVGLSSARDRALPLLLDQDGDRDLDVLLFPWNRGVPAKLYRGDVDDDCQVVFGLAPFADLPAFGPVRAVVPLDPRRPASELYLVRPRAVDRLLVLDPDTYGYVDASRARKLPDAATVARLAVAADFDGGDGPDLLLVEEAAAPLLLLRGADGSYAPARGGVTGFGAPPQIAQSLAAEDLNRDGRPDLFVPGSLFDPPRLLLNQGVDPSTGALGLLDEISSLPIPAPAFPARASTALRAADCDHAVDLLVPSLGQLAPGQVVRFPDDSAAHVVTALGGIGVASGERSCVDGSGSVDLLTGHRRASALRGLGGDDTLVALGGLTVMSGGAGADRFEAAGVTLIHLPPQDVQAGEVVDCDAAREVIVDSPLSRTELEALGVVFEDCGDGTSCELEPVPPELDVIGAEELDCHEAPDPLFVGDFGIDPGLGGMEWGAGLGFLAEDPPGFGTCDEQADCYAFGLDYCLTETGDAVSGGQIGSCFPSPFGGIVTAVSNWCRDPFWARHRYDAIRNTLVTEGRMLVVPITAWLPRSAAANDDGTCSQPGAEVPRSLDGWQASFGNGANSGIATYSKWGITFDYRFRVFQIPADSPFVVDPATDPCRTDLAPGGSSANSVGKLLEAYPAKFTPGELNVYLSDKGGASYSSKATVDLGAGPETVRFVLLRNGGGAFRHEIGHALGLPHPFSRNVSASGAAPDDAESRDSWAVRPFPTPGNPRLLACGSDADCDGVDATAGLCRKAPGQLLGFCQNLKRDCSEHGDHVCDTPWDAFPCFEKVDHMLGAPCTADADCWKESSTRGTNYAAVCGGTGTCVKRVCTQASDCPQGSFCADGTCIIWKSGTDACCELRTDMEPGFEHDVCFERQGGEGVPVAGVGTGSWPIQDNLMTYHRPFGFVRTVTEGQRDQVVCSLVKLERWGPPMRLQNDSAGSDQPCSLRPGATPSSYGHMKGSRLMAHGACDSGVCQVTDLGASSTAVCVPASCSDGIASPGEASVDCGGVCPAPCPTSRNSGPSSSACFGDADCLSGICAGGHCLPSCSDGRTNAVELALDQGGASYDPSCPALPAGSACRFDVDCPVFESCANERECVHDPDCPVNDVDDPCQVDADCPNGGACKPVEKLCSTPGCFTDLECPSGFCQLPAGRCACSDDADCPGGANVCEVARSFCTAQCVEGRCLGQCQAVIGP